MIPKIYQVRCHNRWLNTSNPLTVLGSVIYFYLCFIVNTVLHNIKVLMKLMILTQTLVYQFLLQLNTVWVSCVGEDPHDNESIGEINYYPDGQGFPGYYYPYQNIPGYLSPVVAVHFLRPASKSISISLNFNIILQRIFNSIIFRI